MINQISRATKFSVPKRPNLWIPLSFLLLTGGLLVMVLFGTLGYQILFLNRGYPGVSVAGVKIAGMTQGEIVTSVATQASPYIDRPVTVQIGAESRTFTGQELGMRVDVIATADQAYNVGRTGNLLGDMYTHLALIFSPREIDPIILYERGPTEELLHGLSEVVDYPPQDAQLVIDSANNVSILPAQRGRRLHVGATRPLIEEALFGHENQPVVAFTQEVLPAILDDDVAEAFGQAKALLNGPLTFKYSSDTDAGEWQLNPETLAAMVRVVEPAAVDDGDPTQLTIELDREMLANHFEAFAKVISQEASDARFRFDDETGELQVLQRSSDGRTLDVERAQEITAAAVRSGSDVVELPVLTTPAVISSNDLEALGIKQLVSESTSYFKGSSGGRVRNIALSASKFDGVVIPPGEIFSFNQHLGPVTAEAGFDESLIIFGDRTTVGIGGGVCQVSTTAFRTAFFGGYELVERWAHGYRVSWYEINSVPGLDATIYTPDVDFKFRNDTGHHLLIHTETDEGEGTLTFKFYGSPTDREVLVSEPVESNIVKHGAPVYEETPDLPKGIIKQVDWPKNGLEVTVTRVVKQGDTLLHEDEVVSTYRPWRAVYRVGTGN
jgi:vancomycin resistance protein YoaR